MPTIQDQYRVSRILWRLKFAAVKNLSFYHPDEETVPSTPVVAPARSCGNIRTRGKLKNGGKIASQQHCKRKGSLIFTSTRSECPCFVQGTSKKLGGLSSVRIPFSTTCRCIMGSQQWLLLSKRNFFVVGVILRT